MAAGEDWLGALRQVGATLTPPAPAPRPEQLRGLSRSEALRYAERYRQPGERPDRVAIEIAVDRVLGRA